MPDPIPGKLSRREFLKYAGAGIGLIASGGLLAACEQPPKPPDIPGLVLLNKNELGMLESQATGVYEVLRKPPEFTEQDKKILHWLFGSMEESGDYAGALFYRPTMYQFNELNILKDVPHSLPIYRYYLKNFQADYAYNVELPEGTRRMLAVGLSYVQVWNLYLYNPPKYLDNLERGLSIVEDMHRLYDPNGTPVNTKFVPPEALVPLTVLGWIDVDPGKFEANDQSMKQKFGNITLERVENKNQVMIKIPNEAPTGSNTLIFTYDDRDPDAITLAKFFGRYGKVNLQEFSDLVQRSDPYRTVYARSLLKKSLRNFLKPIFPPVMEKVREEFDEFAGRIPALRSFHDLRHPLTDWSKRINDPSAKNEDVIDPRMVVITEKGKDGKLGVLRATKSRMLHITDMYNSFAIVFDK